MGGGPGIVLNPPSAQDSPTENDLGSAPAVLGGCDPQGGGDSSDSTTNTGRAKAPLGTKNRSLRTDQNERLRSNSSLKKIYLYIQKKSSKRKRLNS